MQKGSAQLFLIVMTLLLVIGGGIYFLRSNKKTVNLAVPYNTYNNYNNYSNQALGFEFQYSKDLTVKTDSEEEFNKRGNGNFRKNFKGYVGYEPAKSLGAVAVLDKSDAYDTSPFSVWVFDNPNNLTIDQWFKDYWYYPYLWGVFDWSSKNHITPDTEATISGQPAKSKVVAYQPGKPKFMYVAKDQKMYLFRVLGETGDKILSSLKLVN